jgi:predicted nucleotidyltransferase
VRWTRAFALVHLRSVHQRQRPSNAPRSCITGTSPIRRARLLSAELSDLAEILADWIKPAPGVPAIYLFGSRVRGDHRPDSDVDVRLFLDEWKSVCDATMRWWNEQNETDFAAVKARLPGPLAIHREQSDEADAAIRKGRESPVLTVERVVCVWTPRKART